MNPILPSAPIDQFDEYNDPIEGDFFPIVDVRTSKTKKIDVKYFFTAPPSTNYKWSSAFDYQVDNIVEHLGKWYKSLQNPNLGKNPATELAYWELQSKAQSGFVYWTPGIYTGENVIVLKKTAGRTAIYELIDPIRPFISTDFDAELAADQWQIISADNIYDLASPTTVTVGGLLSGTNITGWTVNQILQAMVTGIEPGGDTAGVYDSSYDSSYE